MKAHTKIYLKFFDYGEHQDVFICCEVPECPQGRANDIQHLDPRRMGGSKTKDYIENLMALCREHHNQAEDDKEFNESLKTIHLAFIREHRPDYEISAR